MSSAQYPKTKTWAPDEDLTSADLNAFHDNERSNLNPQGVGGYEDTVPQMQLQTSPGGVGSESLGRSLSDEIERLRFKLAQVLGTAFWYDAPAISLAEANTLINQISGLPPNRVTSGAVVSASDAQAAVLVPDGAALTVVVKATTTPLIVHIDNVQYTLNADITINGLVGAPSTQNTALVNMSDPPLAADFFSTLKGEYDSSIIIDTVGTNISALIGKYAAFKIVHGGNTEYFTAFVKSGTELTNAKRGYFFNSSSAPITRIAISDDDTITLMKLTWIFLKSDLTAEAVYTNPTYSFAAPSSPSIGDYWFDMNGQTWKRFSGTMFVAASAVLLGSCIQSTTACVGARTFESYANFTDLNTLRLGIVSNTEVEVTEPGATVNVNGRMFSFSKGGLVWDITTNLESGYVEAASTPYILYLTERGDVQISPVYPYFREDLGGTYYHPYHLWRMVGIAWNNGSSNLTQANDIVQGTSSEVFVTVGNGHGSTLGAFVRRYTNETSNTSAMLVYQDSVTDGASFVAYWPCKISFSAMDSRSGGSGLFGILFNEPVIATGFQNQAQIAGAANPQTVLAFSAGAAGDFMSVVASRKAIPGDVFRPRDDNNNNAVDVLDSYFRALVYL